MLSLFKCKNNKNKFIYIFKNNLKINPIHAKSTKNNTFEPKIYANEAILNIKTNILSIYICIYIIKALNLFLYPVDIIMTIK